MNYINYFQQQAALPEGTLPPSQEANELGLPLSEFIEAMTMADFHFFFSRWGERPGNDEFTFPYGELSGWWLSWPTPLKNDGVSSSVGMMIIPNWMEHKKCLLLKMAHLQLIYLLKWWFFPVRKLLVYRKVPIQQHVD